MHQDYGSGREVKRLHQHLWENEDVDSICVGTYGRGQGLLVLTNRRLFFLHLGAVRGTTEEDFPFAKISSVKWSSGIISGTVTVSLAGNSEAEIRNVNRQDGKAITDRARAVIAGEVLRGSAESHPAPAVSPAQPPPPPPPGVPAGWYPDADNDRLLRYWDGREWTDHTAPNAG